MCRIHVSCGSLANFRVRWVLWMVHLNDIDILQLNETQYVIRVAKHSGVRFCYSITCARCIPTRGRTSATRAVYGNFSRCFHFVRTPPLTFFLCFLRFKMEKHLDVHRLTHTASKFKCNQCDKTYRSKFSLQKHLELHTGSIAKPFVCDICGTGFRRNADLKVSIIRFRPFITLSDSCFFFVHPGEASHVFFYGEVRVQRRI